MTTRRDRLRPSAAKWSLAPTFAVFLLLLAGCGGGSEASSSNATASAAAASSVDADKASAAAVARTSPPAAPASAAAATADDPSDRLGPPSPPLPKPYATPSVNHASNIIGWPAGTKPKAPHGFVVELWAGNLESPRWLYQLPNGDVLVAEADTHLKNTGRIVLLRGGGANGAVTERHVFLDNDDGNLHQPFGIALVGHVLYIANTDGLWRYHYKPGDIALDSKRRAKVLDLPADGYNNHWTRNVFASRDQRRLYVTVGSATNVDQENVDVNDRRRASILEYTIATGRWRVFASGLRNPNGLGWEPVTGALWAAVNERDELGDDLVPDFVTHIRDGGFYGWPYFYFGRHADPRKAGQRDDLRSTSIVPDLAVGAHTATLGLAFASGSALPPQLRHGLFIGQHGSWNRNELAGYRVAFVPFDERGHVAGPAQDFLTGFVADADSRQVHGRPVGVLMLQDGSLLVADDAAECLWRVRYVGGRKAPPSIGGLMLYDATRNTPIEPFENGLSLNDAAMRTHWYSVVATSTAALGSVRFVVDGKTVSIDNSAPYALAGDVLRGSVPVLRHWRVTRGTHILEVTPYSGANGKGTAGETVSVRFRRPD